jgi:hypothetical protein
MWAFINHSGNLREVQNCDWVSDFTEDLCIVRSSGIEGIMDRDFRQKYFDSVEHIVEFRSGYSAARRGRMYGYIDPQGHWVIPPEFTHAQSTSNGYALAFKGRRSFIFNRDLELVRELEQGEVEWYSEGFFNVSFPGRGEHFFLDESFTTRYGPYTSASPFYNGRALVSKGDREYFIDTNDQEVFEVPGLGSRGVPWEGLYVFWDNCYKHGYFDLEGKVCIAPQFDEAWGFCCGRARVKLNDKWYYIDLHGQLLSEAYERAGDFSEDVAPVCSDGSWCYIDKEFRPLFNKRFELAIKFSEGLGRIKLKQGVD